MWVPWGVLLWIHTQTYVTIFFKGMHAVLKKEKLYVDFFHLGIKLTAEVPCIRKPFCFVHIWLCFSIFVTLCLSVSLSVSLYLCFFLCLSAVPLKDFLYSPDCLWTQEPPVFAQGVLGWQLCNNIICYSFIFQGRTWILRFTYAKQACYHWFISLVIWVFWNSKFWLGHMISTSE